MSTVIGRTSKPAAASGAISGNFNLAFVRVAAIAITVVLMLLLPWDRTSGYDEGGYLSLVLSLGFAHYAASFIYARRQIRALGKSAFSWVALAALVAGSVALYVFPKNQELWLIAYFGIHHVCNEVYLSHRALGADFEQVKRLRVFGMALNLALYTAILAREQLVSFFIGTTPIAIVTIVTAIAYCVELARTARQVDRSKWANLLSLELLGSGVGIAVLAFGLQLRFIDIVLYHFVFWALYPATRIAAAQGSSALTRYLGLNAVLLAISLALSPVGFWQYSLTGSLFLESFYFFSYFHISASFAVSDQHPSWIIRLFRAPPHALKGAARG
jgi:hypothetical protein